MKKLWKIFCVVVTCSVVLSIGGYLYYYFSRPLLSGSWTPPVVTLPILKANHNYTIRVIANYPVAPKDVKWTIHNESGYFRFGGDFPTASGDNGSVADKR